MPPGLLMVVRRLTFLEYVAVCCALGYGFCVTHCSQSCDMNINTRFTDDEMGALKMSSNFEESQPAIHLQSQELVGSPVFVYHNRADDWLLPPPLRPRPLSAPDT